MHILAVDFIAFLKYVVLAIIQGIAEILPISSSGHILLFERILGLEGTPLTLAVFLHAGSLIAVLIYFRKEVKAMVVYFFTYLFKKDRSDEAKRYFRRDLMLILATLPAALVGLFLNDLISDKLSDLLYVSINFLVTSLILVAISFLKFDRKIEEMTVLDALLVGGAQAIGVLPGISRSGITIAGLKGCKFENEGSANFAFLMFIPISAGSFFYELIKIVREPSSFASDMWAPYLVGIIIAGVVTYFALYFLLKIIRKGKLWCFSIYLFILGVTVLTLRLCRVL